MAAPQMPLTITEGQGSGRGVEGYGSRTRQGRKFMLKFDVAGHLGMANAGEMIGNRIFHAAGYNVPWRAA